MLARPIPWRVRVRSVVETWVDVQAVSAQEAEVLAAGFPGVLSVFGKSAMPGGVVVDPGVSMSIEE